MKKPTILFAAAVAELALCAATVDRVVVRQQWPWSTDITVEYELGDVTGSTDLEVEVYDGATKVDSALVDSAISGKRYAITSGGTGTLTLDPVTLFGTARANVPDCRVKVTAVDSPANMGEELYRIYSLTGDKECTPVTRAELLNGDYGSIVKDYSSFGSGFDTSLTNVIVWTAVTNDVKYKTTHLVMRKIPAGTFMMGGYNNTPSREVTVSNDFFIGVFEMTQKQCELLSTSQAKAFFSNSTCYATRPMENVTFKNLRGSNGRYWPDAEHYAAATNPASGTYINNLRVLTNNNKFDLPLEMQWEYAARAGTTTRWNNSEDDDTSGDGNTVAPKLARSKYTGGYINGQTAPDGEATSANGTAEVGSYAPNAWGLYDCHGNVYEWCIDRYVDWNDLTDEILHNGSLAADATRHVTRGGGWSTGAASMFIDVRSGPSYSGTGSSAVGWRAYCPAD